MGQTLYEKLWHSHVVAELPDGESLLYIDRHLVHEVSSPQAFRSLAASGRRLRRPETHLAIADHAVPTAGRGKGIADPQAAGQIAELAENAEAFGVEYRGLDHPGHGILHVVGPESGLTLPGMTMVCGDSHTTTHGAFGALAFGIGASECGTVMATQCIRQRRAKTMRVWLEGALPDYASTKDVALALISTMGANGAVGHAVEYAGPAVAGLDMAARMTLCNMTIEAGARVGLIAPDEVTFAWLRDRPFAPKGEQWAMAVTRWQALPSDNDAQFDREVGLNLSGIEPYATWGTNPDQAVPISGRVPDPEALDGAERVRVEKALAYMDLRPGMAMTDIGIDTVFIGSCTNGRIEDLRAAATGLRGRKVAPGVRALAVPGSAATKAQAEAEGLDRLFLDAGFEWRDAGCSMCVAMNNDRLGPGQRCASTSNRNFEGRQGIGGRTHLVSPVTAAAAAIAGHLVDIRRPTGGRIA